VLDGSESSVHRAGDVGDRLVALEVHEVTRGVLSRDVPVRGVVPDLAGRRAHDREPRRPLGRDERVDPFVEADAAADRTPQRQVRVPATRHEERVTLDRPAFPAWSLEVHRLEPAVALGPRDDPAAEHLRVRDEIGVALGPADVRDDRHLATVRDQVRSRAVRVGPRGEQDRARADEHPVLEGIQP
jgi:hypothetical protein